MYWKVPALLLLLAPLASGKGARPIDGDRDGLPDSWERRYFQSAEDCNPGDDSDSDGIPNLQEFLGDSHPMEARGAHVVASGGGGGGGAAGGGGGRHAAFSGAPAFNDFTPGFGPMNNQTSGAMSSLALQKSGGGYSGGGYTGGGYYGASAYTAGVTMSAGTLNLGGGYGGYGSSGLTISGGTDYNFVSERDFQSGSNTIYTGGLNLNGGLQGSLTIVESDLLNRNWNWIADDSSVSLVGNSRFGLATAGAGTVGTLRGSGLMYNGGVLDLTGSGDNALVIGSDPFASGTSVYAAGNGLLIGRYGLNILFSESVINTGAETPWAFSLTETSGIVFEAITPVHSGLSLGSGGYPGSLSYSSGGSDGNVALVYVPEPGGAALCGLAALLTLARRRR